MNSFPPTFHQAVELAYKRGRVGTSMNKMLIASELVKIAEILTAFGPPKRNFDTAAEFVQYLRGTLIPDLKASGNMATADDFMQVVRLLNWKRPDANFVRYLKGTLIPDLEDSGMTATAEDFEEAVAWLEEL